MIHIALVEDNQEYAQELQGFLARYQEESGQPLRVTRFEDGDEIALGYKAIYDIILMDIEMKFMDGITAAEEIRKKDTEVVILFITNMPQFAIKGYAVDAMDYVLKPISYYAFSQRIDKAIKRMEKRKKRYISVPVSGGAVKIDVSRLLYVEVQGRGLVYHTDEEDIAASGTMKGAEEALGSESFFRCNKGYLVNLEHVRGFQNDDVLVGRDRLQISRSRKKAFMDALNYFVNEVDK